MHTLKYGEEPNRLKTSAVSMSISSLSKDQNFFFLRAVLIELGSSPIQIFICNSI